MVQISFLFASKDSKSTRVVVLKGKRKSKVNAGIMFKVFGHVRLVVTALIESQATVFYPHNRYSSS
jgi:hypothetical protein